MVFQPSRNYGDKTKIESNKQSAGGFHQERGTSGPMVQSNAAGRPSASPMVPQTPVVASQSQGIPPEHEALITNYAIAKRAYDKLAPLAAAADAGSRLRFYADLARQQLEAAAAELKSATPDYL